MRPYKVNYVYHITTILYTFMGPFVMGDFGSIRDFCKLYQKADELSVANRNFHFCVIVWRNQYWPTMKVSSQLRNRRATDSSKLLH